MRKLRHRAPDQPGLGTARGGGQRPHVGDTGRVPVQDGQPGPHGMRHHGRGQHLGMSQRHRAGDGVGRGDAHHRVGDHLKRQPGLRDDGQSIHKLRREAQRGDRADERDAGRVTRQLRAAQRPRHGHDRLSLGAVDDAGADQRLGGVRQRGREVGQGDQVRRLVGGIQQRDIDDVHVGQRVEDARRRRHIGQRCPAHGAGVQVIDVRQDAGVGAQHRAVGIHPRADLRGAPIKPEAGRDGRQRRRDQLGREGDTCAGDPAAEAGQPLAHLDVIHLDPDLIQNAERGLVDLLQAGGGREEVIIWHDASDL